MRYDAALTASFFDEYGEREWTRFEDGRTPPTSFTTHRHYLERFIESGDRVLDIGCGPGRFTLELARLGASVVAADLSPVQLDLHRRFTASVEGAVENRVVADVLDLSQFADDSFDATVCFGGALSYVLDDAPRAAAELARVTRPGGLVLTSVMALVGSTIHAFDGVLAAVQEHGPEAVTGVTRTGRLPQAYGGHLPMKLFRWRELAELLGAHGEIVAVSATGLFRDAGEHAEFFAQVEIDLGREPGALDAGHHILAVIRA